MAADASEKQAKEATDEKQKECDDLKTLIGFPERSTEEIKKQFAEDMKTYGNEKNETDKAAGDKPLFDPSDPVLQPLAGGHVQGHPGPHRRTYPIAGPIRRPGNAIQEPRGGQG